MKLRWSKFTCVVDTALCFDRPFVVSCSVNRLEWSVYTCLTRLYLMVEIYLVFLHKVQLHVSALDNGHLQVVHEILIK